MERSPSITGPSTGSGSQPESAKKYTLCELTPLDQRTEELDERSKRCYLMVTRLIEGKSAPERQEIYAKHIAANPQVHSEELIIGLAVALLAEEHPDEGNKISEYYQDIVTISKDNLLYFSSYINTLITERISKVTTTVLKRIFWVANQLFKAGAMTAESTCSNLVRQTAKSDLSERNIFMAENLMNLLCDNRNWLINSTQFMGPTVIFNLMRLMNDHCTPPHKSLRQRETDFVIGLIKERFDFVLQIGRDFLRLLQYLITSKIPEFQQLYHDIYNNPKVLHPKFEGPQQLLITRTPRRLFQTCLTFDMERKVSYIATQVKFGNQRRYQEWFAKSHFSGYDTNSLLRCDLIRYICTIIHPSNEVLCSDIIPRWAIIGWLLTTASHVVVNCRLALFFDWFAYDPWTDNIMNIEPGILIMAHSVRSHPQVTSNLLEFLCRAPAMFPSKISGQIRMGIKKSLQQILEKRVLQSLTPVFLNPKFDPNLKQLVKESFPEYCPVDNGITTENTHPHHRPTSLQTATQQVAAQSSLAPSPATPPPLSPNLVSSPNHVTQISTDTHQVNLKQPEIITLDDSNSESPSSNLLGSKSTAAVDTKQSNQDVNHNARVSNPSKQDCTKKPTREPTTKLSNNTESDPINELDETVKLSVAPATIKQKRSLSMKSYPESNPDQDTNTGHEETNSENPKSMHVTGTDCLDILDVVETSNHSDSSISNISPTTTKVMYPFMMIRSETCRVATRLMEPYADILDSIEKENSIEDRCKLVDRLLSIISDGHKQLTSRDTDQLMAYLACRLEQPLSNDFLTRIHDLNNLERSITKPLFVLCREIFKEAKLNDPLIKLLVNLTRAYPATSFLVLYYMRTRYCIWNTPSSQHYINYCEACNRDLNDALHEDLGMMYTYDSEMFCFTLPTIFSEYATAGPFNITNNIDLIHKTVSALDPINLHELMCFCLTGTCKVFNRENPLAVIEASLKWESWEQYCFWKLLSAQSVPLEHYISLISTLNTKSHPEALSSIMLNLQKCIEPSSNVIQHLITAHNKQNEQFVVSVIRHWAIKTDVKELAEKIVSLIEARSLTQVKRKGQNRVHNKSATLSKNDEKILGILEHIRAKAPRNKLFAQNELFDGLADIEAVCDENQKKQFAQLFAYRRVAPAKKKKLDKDT